MFLLVKLEYVLGSIWEAARTLKRVKTLKTWKWDEFKAHAKTIACFVTTDSLPGGSNDPASILVQHV